MKRVPTKKLEVNTKTIRTLTESQLRSVVGGMEAGPTEPSKPPATCNQSSEAGSGGCPGTGGGPQQPK